MTDTHPTLWPSSPEVATPQAMILHYAAVVVSNTGALHCAASLSPRQFDRAVAAAVGAGTSLLLLTALRDGRAVGDVARELYEGADDDGQDMHQRCWDLLLLAGYDPQAIAAAGAKARAEATAKEAGSRG